MGKKNITGKQNNKKLVTDGGQIIDDNEESEDSYDAESRDVSDSPDLENYVNNEVMTDGGEDSPDYSEWKEFEHEDKQFLEVGDKVKFNKGDETVVGKIRQKGDNNLFGVDTDNEDNVTIETWDIEEYQSQQNDDLDEIRSELREHFEKKGVGTHSRYLEQWTDDSQYRDFQEQLKQGEEVAKESPMYDVDPEMETCSAILATTDEDTAKTIETIQNYAKEDLPREMEVYRGISVDDPDEFLSELEEEGSLTDPRFQSTSISEDVADGFGNIKFEVQTDHGVYLRAASEHAGEDEILLPAGTEYEVDSVDKENNTVEVTAKGGYDFGSLDVSGLRKKIEEDGKTYSEAVEEMV